MIPSVSFHRFIRLHCSSCRGEWLACRSVEEANKAPPLSASQTPCDTLNPPQNKVCQYNSLGSQLLTAEASFFFFFYSNTPWPTKSMLLERKLLSCLCLTCLAFQTWKLLDFALRWGQDILREKACSFIGSFLYWCPFSMKHVSQINTGLWGR